MKLTVGCNFFYLIILLLFVQCKNKTADKPLQTSILWEYREYVSSFTNGEISKQGEIQVKFAKAIEDVEIGDELPVGFFTIEPKVTGKVTLIDSNTISFKPDNTLQSDKRYTIKLKLDKVFVDNNFKEPFTFQIKTIKPDFSVLIDAIQTSKTIEEQQEVYGHIETADITELDQIKKILTAKQASKSLPIEFLDAEGGKYFNFIVKEIEQGDQKSEIELSWNGRALNIDNKGSETISLPGKNDFKIIRSFVEEEPEQLLKLNFSNELDKGQNLDGLIRLDGKDSGFEYSINGNLLQIYPQTTLSGDIDLVISEGIKSISGNKSSQYAENITFKGAKPEVRLINSGTILPNSQGLKLNFETVSLRAIDVRISKIYEENALQFLQNNSLNGSNELKRVGRPLVWKRILLNNNANSGWNAYSLDLAELIDADPGAIYHVEFSFKKAYSTYDCETPNEEVLKEETIFYKGKNKYWDNQSYYDDYWSHEVYEWRERDNPCHEAYYGSSKMSSTNVLASDLGLIAKKGENGDVLAITTDLITAQPVSGATVKFYNFQMSELASVTSTTNGFAKYDGEEEVFFIKATSNSHNAYIKLSDGESLSTSQFETDGYTTKEGLKGLIYAERGIWRPGDDIYFSFILNDMDNPLPENHPIKFELRDPEGAIVDEQISNDGINGFYSFKTRTQESDKTGTYTAKITVGNVAFYKSIAIEKIKPNRLKINFEVKDNENASLGAKWLHGATAGNLKTTVDANLRSQVTSFDGYSDYIFDDPASTFEAEEIRIFSNQLDDQGKANFTVKFDKDLDAPGKLRATYITKVYEKGGNFSIDALSQDYSPYDSYVGILTPEGKNYYKQLDTDEMYQFNIVTLNEKGNPLAVDDLEVEVYKVNFRWWWNRSNENFSSYVSDESRDPVFTTKVTTNNNGRAEFKFGINYPEWGRYLVRVKNPKSGHITGKTVYFDWPSWRGRSQAGGADAANILDFSTDKESYKTGEKIKINFPSSPGGRALVSIENGSKVMDAFWVNPTNDFTKLEYIATKEMAPGAYINITYLQQHANTVNDLPLRLYGVVPIEVYDENTKLEPKIIMNDEIEPEENNTIKVKEEKGRAMTYTLAVVDEGLLDLTRFKTPNAWDQFFQKPSLGVKSWDVYDDVIGAYSGRIDQIFSLGGGDAAEAAGAQKAQRFKPVVTYLGPFNLEKNQTAKHDIKMPYYVGSVRVMVVAGDNKNNAFGSTEKAVPVKKPLMILGTLPRKISQNELIDLPVSIFAMENKIKNVTLSLKTNELLEVIGNVNQNVSFTQTGEKEAAFQLKTTGATGIAKVEIIASGGGETAKYEVEIDVTNPNEREYKFSDFELGPNQVITVPVDAISTNGTDEAILQFSTLPNLDFSKRIEELIKYPHGCAEQVTSSVFPQLFLPDIANVSASQEQQISRNVQDAIYRLKNYQSRDGGFQYWPGNGSSDDFVSSYVGHFLIEAKEKGYEIPFNMIVNWKQYQNKAANKNYTSTSNYTTFKQAYRLYSLALGGSPNLSAMNRLRETSELSKETRWRLAAAYALVGQEKTARKLINVIKDDFNDYDEIYIYGSKLRNQAMALETALLLDDEKLGLEYAENIAKNLSQDRWFSTQTTAYSLFALSKFIEDKGGAGFKVQINGNGANSNVETAKAIAVHNLNPPSGNEFVEIKNLKSNSVFVRLSQSGIPPVGEETAYSKGLRLNVSYLDIEGKPIEVNQLPQATELIAKINITNLSKDYVNHIALTQVIPSGWEIVNTRYTELGENQPDKADYIDIRDDRVNYYLSLSGNQTKSFQLQLNASFTGKYYLPGSIAEAMYDKDNYYVKQKGKWITVTD